MYTSITSLIVSTALGAHASIALKLPSQAETLKRGLQKYGKIDVFVSNAAVNPGVGPMLDMAESQLDKILEINVKVSILLVKVGEFSGF